jgi:hypothetical protein
LSFQNIEPYIFSKGYADGPVIKTSQKQIDSCRHSCQTGENFVSRSRRDPFKSLLRMFDASTDNAKAYPKAIPPVMGLIMIILIGVAPATYALNRDLPDAHQPAYIATLDAGEAAFIAHANGETVPTLDIARSAVAAVRRRKIDTPALFGALAMITVQIERQIHDHKALRNVPSADMPQLRNDMYLVNGALGILKAEKAGYPEAEVKALNGLEKTLNDMTRYIPDWVKVATALALGLGTMVGWKRIVVTVGEKIGNSRMTYGQGAAGASWPLSRFLPPNASACRFRQRIFCRAELLAP